MRVEKEDRMELRTNINLQMLTTKRDKLINELESLKRQEEFCQTEKIVLKVRIADLTVKIHNLNKCH